MALSDKLIDAEAFARWGDMKGAPLAMCRGFARAIEVGVRKQDEALIRQMLDAMVGVKDLRMGGELALWTAEFDRMLAAINAANARLAQPPTA